MKTIGRICKAVKICVTANTLKNAFGEAKIKYVRKQNTKIHKTNYVKFILGWEVLFHKG